MKRECDSGEASWSVRKKKKMKKVEVVSSDEQPPRPCTECGKKFWSWKALFGHMRCHPERQWRGINPPSNLMIMRRQEKEMSEEDDEVASCLLLLSHTNAKDKDVVDEDLHFECSSCNKIFGSHQALGGHRASHKNVKGCFANEEVIVNNNNNNNCHQCSICLKVFSTGQALGGHKRCHWDSSSSSKSSLPLDLNFPPPSSPLTLDLRLGL